MRFHLPLLALAALGSTAIAQTTQQFEYTGWQTSYTSRGSLGTGVGELLQGIHSSHNLGVHENASDVNVPPVANITQFAMVHQDQNCATPETFAFVVRSGTDAAGPDGTSGGLIAEITGLALPNSTTNGACAWIQTYNLATTAYIPVPTDKFWAMGTRLTASPNWAMDGHSTHTSYGVSTKPDQNSWNEVVTTGIQNHAWQLVGAATTATTAGNGLTWRYITGSHGVLMQLGCGTTGAPGIGYGMGGMFPKESTPSAPLGFHARLRGGTGLAGAANVVALAPGGLFPFAIPFGSGANLYINTGGMFLFFGPAADTNGQAVVTMAPFIPNLGLGGTVNVWFQAAFDSASTGIRLTNAVATSPQ